MRTKEYKESLHDSNTHRDLIPECVRKKKQKQNQAQNVNVETVELESELSIREVKSTFDLE